MLLEISEIMDKVEESDGWCLINHSPDKDNLGMELFDLHINVNPKLGYHKNENFLTYANNRINYNRLESFLQSSVMKKINSYEELCLIPSGEYIVMLQDERIVPAQAVIVKEEGFDDIGRAFVHWEIDKRHLDMYDNELNTSVIGYAKRLSPITEYNQSDKLYLR